jgi:hypothetical protein
MFRDREKFFLRGLIATVSFAVVLAMSGTPVRAGGFFSWYRNGHAKDLMIRWDGRSWKRM